jgi:hypothetical protein
MNINTKDTYLTGTNENPGRKKDASPICIALLEMGNGCAE